MSKDKDEREEQEQQGQQEKQDPEVVIEVENLVQCLGGQEVLRGINLQVRKGEFLGIFGFAGSGKTTLLHILAGVDRFRGGTVKVLGDNVRQRQRFKRQVGLMTQGKSLFQDLRAGENLDFLATLKGARRQHVDKVIKQLELTDSLNEPVGRMTLGAYQRLSLACALLGDPVLLLADEPIGSIDLKSRQIIIREMTRFNREGGTIVCCLGNMEYFSCMSRLAWLEDGGITMYTPDQAIERWNHLQDSYPQQSDGGQDADEV